MSTKMDIDKKNPVVVQSLSCVRLFETHGIQYARLPCPSPSPGACSNSCPLITKIVSATLVHTLQQPLYLELRDLRYKNLEERDKWRQRLEWCVYKSKNTKLADSHQKGEERQEMDFPSEPMEETNLVKALIKGFWLLELWENTFLLFKAITFVLICYSMPGH